MGDERDNMRVIRPDGVMLRSATDPGYREDWGDEFRQVIKEIWLTVGFRSATRSLREYAKWCEPGTKLPSAGTVRMWVLRYSWWESADDDMRGKLMQETRQWLERAQPLFAESLYDDVSRSLEPDATEFDRAAGIKAREFGMRMFGWGSFGAQGGNMEQGSADGSQVERDMKDMSQEDKMRLLRDELAIDRHVAGS